MKYIKKKVNNIKQFVYNSPIEKVIFNGLMIYLECVVLLGALFYGLASMGIILLIGSLMVNKSIIIAIAVFYLLSIVVLVFLGFRRYSSKVGKSARIMLIGIEIMPLLTVGAALCAIIWWTIIGEFYVC